MLEKKGKVWGNTTEVFSKPTFSVHYLDIKKEGYCSEHKHVQKNNLFYVISGVLKVLIYKDSGLQDSTVLKEGQALSIEPGLFHKFIALTDVSCLEVYYPCDISEDIIRRTVGGYNGRNKDQ